jgi:hypothetical protein
MTTEIKSKIFNYGDENEGTWPPQFGTGEHGTFYIDANGEAQAGYPPPRNIKFGDAPYFISDSMEPYRHPATGQVVESKSALRAIDNATGTITTDKKLPPDPSRNIRLRQEAKQKRMEHLREVVQLVDSGNAPLTEDLKQICKQRNQVIKETTGLDAFNVAGEKKNGR